MEAALAVTSPSFSLMRLLEDNPGLAQNYLWGTNPAISAEDAPWLHLGCGVRVFDGFTNLDICPQDARVIKWNFLDLWPDDLDGRVEGVFSEDCLEHFFHAEQAYILCNINRAMKLQATARILMPSLAKVVGSYNSIRGLIKTPYGMETGADQLNHGMRFTGHRWLHDQQSFGRMAEICGFTALETGCAKSTVTKFDGLNLRDELTSASFANDLRKTVSISRTLFSPTRIKGALKIEGLPSNASLFLATEARPVVEYLLPRAVESESVACINLRSSNLSSFDWCLKTIVFDEINRVNPWLFDEMLKSQPCMNIVTQGQLMAAIGARQIFSKMEFYPAANAGEYFTLGCAEMFTL